MTDPGQATIAKWERKQRVRDWATFGALIIGAIVATLIFWLWPQWGWLAFVLYFGAALSGGIVWIVNVGVSYIMRTPTERR